MVVLNRVKIVQTIREPKKTTLNMKLPGRRERRDRNIEDVLYFGAQCAASFAGNLMRQLMNYRRLFQFEKVRFKIKLATGSSHAHTFTTIVVCALQTGLHSLKDQ